MAQGQTHTRDEAHPIGPADVVTFDTAEHAYLFAADICNASALACEGIETPAEFVAGISEGGADGLVLGGGAYGVFVYRLAKATGGAA